MVTARLPQEEIDRAVEALREGDLVVFPTETVYGLGADAHEPGAIRRIFELKGRPASHPLIVHIEHPRSLDRWALDVPESAHGSRRPVLAGPADARAAACARGRSRRSRAGRTPSPCAYRRIRSRSSCCAAFGSGIAAPSANRYGHVSPTRAEHVREEFGDELPIILEGGDCKLGLESTIVSCVDDVPRVLRPGSITLCSCAWWCRPCVAGAMPLRRACRAATPSTMRRARRSAS